LPTSGGHKAKLAGGFDYLLVFYSNHMPKKHKWTDGQTDK